MRRGVSNPSSSRWLGAMLLLATLCLAQPVEALAQDEGLDDYNFSVSLYRQDRWKDAAEAFRKYLKTYPKHDKRPFAQLYLGLTLVNQQDYKAARDELRKFVKDYPDNTNLPQARYRVAECSYLLDDLPTARTELETYLKEHPQDRFADRAWPYLGDVFLREGNAEQALRAFDVAVKDYPKGSLAEDARFGRARALQALKKFDDALAQFQEISTDREGTRAAEALFQIGALQFDRQQFAEATAAYQELAKRFPENPLVPSAQLNAGNSMYQAGEYLRAGNQFAKILDDKTHGLTAGYWQGLSLKSAGQYPEAAKAFAAVAARAADQPLLENVLFQQALCERQTGALPEALVLFQTVLEKWPAGEHADDSLHAAGELALELGDLPRAQELVDRFVKEFPKSGLRMYHELLAGRLLLAQSAVAVRDQRPGEEIGQLYRDATQRFEKVLQESELPRTKLQARYLLALTFQLQSDHARALEYIAPVTEAALAEGEKSEFADALIVQADSLIATRQFKPADDLLQRYRLMNPQGRQSARALSLQAVAAAGQGDATRAVSLLDDLQKRFPESPLIASTTFHLAELSEGKQDWAAAATYYERLIPLSDGTDNQAFAIRGLAWARYQMKDFPAAAVEFERVVKEFPRHRLAGECAYRRGEALREAGQIEAAALAHRDTLATYGPAEPAPPGADQKEPLIFPYLAGLQAARMLGKLDKPAEADPAYAAVAARFPKAAHLDRLLNEWALLNYAAGSFDRADEIFRRLVSETPASDLADNARLSLAESDLIAGRFDQARAEFSRLADDPASDDGVKERSLYQLIVLAVDQQKWSEIPVAAERLVKDFPESPHRWYGMYARAEALLAAAKPSEADVAAARKLLTELRTALTDNPEMRREPWTGRVWVQLADVALRQKEYDQIGVLAADLRKLSPTSPVLYQLDEVLGRALKQQAKFEDARRAFERVVADPQGRKTETAAKAQFLIGETLFLQEQWHQAFLAYQRVYSTYESPEWRAAALLQSAKCDEKQNQWKEAVATYEQLVTEFPQSMLVAEALQRQEAAKKKAGSS